MFRLSPRFLARALTVAATLPALATVQATTIVPAEGMQSAGASLHHSILSIGTPPVTPTFPVQQSLRLTPGSTPSMMSPGGPVDYVGGSGVAAEAFVNGPAVFAPDVVRPFLGETWAAASARTGQIRAQVHGSMFEQTRSLPRPDGGSYQFDRVGANYGNASGSISNVWTMELDRQAIFTPRPDGSRQYNPLQFGITLDVETRVAVNTANAFVFTPKSVDPGTVGLFFSISFERLLVLDGSPRPETLPDGSPSVVTYTQRFEFDASQQGRRTLRFEYAADAAYRWPAPPRSFVLQEGGAPWTNLAAPRAHAVSTMSNSLTTPAKPISPCCCSPSSAASAAR
jgi:hypothetical protein